MGEKRTCFVISAIGAPGSDERKHADLVLNYIIKKAAKEAGYEVMRGDDHGRSGMITVDVINALFDADLVVADLSFHNPNVFYELGLRHSTRKPTIHIASQLTDLPFDNADHRTIFYDITDWESHQQARRLLKRQIVASVSNPVTNPVTIARPNSEDDRLSRMLEAVTTFLDQLDGHIKRLTEEPDGTFTPAQQKALTAKHQADIIDIVRAIRRRIDARNGASESPPATHVQDVLRRLDAVERTIERLAVSGANIHAPSPIQQ